MNKPWKSINPLIALFAAAQSKRWSWTRNTAFKYINLRIDTRDLHTLVFDRNNEPVDIDMVEFQQGRDQLTNNVDIDQVFSLINGINSDRDLVVEFCEHAVDKVSGLLSDDYLCGYKEGIQHFINSLKEVDDGDERRREDGSSGEHNPQ